MNMATDEHGLDVVRTWLSDRCGMSFPDHKRDLLRQRLARVLRSFALRDMNSLAQQLKSGNNQDVQLAIMSAASINHTFFFRETEVMEKFIAQAEGALATRNEIRIWSAACSSGDEAYTLAIMLAERFGPSILKRLNILGTDISGPVVERAELGVFHSRQLSSLPPALRTKYFTPTGISQFRISQQIRSCCTFRRMNLKATPYPFNNEFFGVMCRNILYYFDHKDQVQTVNAIYQKVERGGYLMTSVTESVRNLGTKFTPIDASLYQKVVT